MTKQGLCQSLIVFWLSSLRSRSSDRTTGRCARWRSGHGAAGTVTVYEGARLIVGDGSAPIEDSAFVVDGQQVHRGRPKRGQVKVAGRRGSRRI